MSEPELAAGKLCALFARIQARDLFDAHQLLTQREIDKDQLRIAFTVYGGINRLDWRTVDVTQINLDPTDAERMLVPTIRDLTVTSTRPASHGVRELPTPILLQRNHRDAALLRQPWGTAVAGKVYIIRTVLRCNVLNRVVYALFVYQNELVRHVLRRP